MNLWDKNRTVFHYLMLWVLIVLIQAVVVWSNGETLVAASLDVIGGVIGVIVFFRRSLLIKFPLSTLMMIGYVFYYFLLPPVATFVEFSPLTNNLNHPVLDYVCILSTFISLSMGYLAYTNSNISQICRFSISKNIFMPMNFFARTSVGDLFVMGVIGLMATVYEVFIAGSTQDYSQGGGVFNKVLQGVMVFSYVPLGLFVNRVIGLDLDNIRINKNVWMVLFFYSLLLAFIGIGANSRSAIFVGFFSVLLMKIIDVLIFSKVDDKKIDFGRLTLLLFFVLIIMGQLSDFATSMEIVRQYRSVDSAETIVAETVKTFFDKDAIRDYRALSRDEYSGVGWDENYVSNPFLARLCNLKFLDETIDLVKNMDNGQFNIVRHSEFEKTISIFPDPVLKFLGLNIDKEFSGTSSGGDILLYAVTHDPYALGGERTGSFMATGLADFGGLFFILLIPISLGTFIIVDSYTTYLKNDNDLGIYPIINPVIATTSFSIFFYFTSAATGVESMSGFTTIFARGWIQILILYWVILGASKCIVTTLGIRRFGVSHK